MPIQQTMEICFGKQNIKQKWGKLKYITHAISKYVFFLDLKKDATSGDFEMKFMPGPVLLSIIIIKSRQFP